MNKNRYQTLNYFYFNRINKKLPTWIAVNVMSAVGSIRPVGKLPIKWTIQGGKKGLLYSETEFHDNSMDELQLQIAADILLHNLKSGVLKINDQLLLIKKTEFNKRRRMKYSESLHRRCIQRTINLFECHCNDQREVVLCEDIHRNVISKEEERLLDRLFRQRVETLLPENSVTARLKEISIYKSQGGVLRANTPRWIMNNSDIVSPARLESFKHNMALGKALSRWQAAESKARLSLLREESARRPSAFGRNRELFCN